MAAGIKKVRNVKKHRVTDLTISSVDSGDRGAGDGCRVMLIKRDPVLHGDRRRVRRSPTPHRRRAREIDCRRQRRNGF